MKRSTVNVYKVDKVDRLGSGVRISASFQIFALTPRENVLGGEENCPRGGLSGEYVRRGGNVLDFDRHVPTASQSRRSLLSISCDVLQPPASSLRKHIFIQYLATSTSPSGRRATLARYYSTLSRLAARSVGRCYRRRRRLCDQRQTDRTA